MIKDNLININNYKFLSKNLWAGLNFLKNCDWGNISDGKHVISDDIYVNIQTYETKSDADYEAHRQYFDIQYIIFGEEKIGVCEYKNCKESVPYSDENDIEFLKGSGQYHEMKVGEFMILYPDDAHKPSISINQSQPCEVRKAVVKVKL